MSRNPASTAYWRRVEGRITVPVPADGELDKPIGSQHSTLNP